MKQTTWIFLMTTFISSSMKAQQTYWAIAEQNEHQPTETIPYLQINANKGIDGSRFGIAAFALLNKYWAEAFFGPSYSWKKGKVYTQISVQAGLETIPETPYRAMSYLFYQRDGDDKGRKKFVGFLAAEYGESGHWYMGFANYKVGKMLGIGAHGQCRVSWGPRIQLDFPLGPNTLSFYGTAGRSMETGTFAGITGLRLQM